MAMRASAVGFIDDEERPCKSWNTSSAASPGPTEIQDPRTLREREGARQAHPKLGALSEEVYEIL